MQESAERQGDICRKLQIFSDRLKARRLRLGLSQESLALKSRTGARSVVAWEQGKNLPNGSKLNQLADTLGVSSAWLLGEDSNEIAHPVPRPDARIQPAAPARVYGLMEESAGRPTTKEDCREHLEKFLDTCGNDPGKIGWAKIELEEALPLNKWKKPE